MYMNHNSRAFLATIFNYNLCIFYFLIVSLENKYEVALFMIDMTPC